MSDINISNTGSGSFIGNTGNIVSASGNATVTIGNKEDKTIDFDKAIVELEALLNKIEKETYPEEKLDINYINLAITTAKEKIKDKFIRALQELSEVSISIIKNSTFPLLSKLINK